ncbi:MAG: acetylglutamate kinase [Archaeoglobaceae archaeon]|uniref:Acetylglutamate kinase n=1 Tax=Archaeoglobus fulgidus TaxID=2234 RepID=A0A7J3M2Y8_ARCFL
MQNVEILLEALPYIKEFHGTVMVFKIGGHAMVSDEILEETVKDILLLHYIGIKPVVVHGGGPEISEKMEKLGLKPRFVEGLRVTDRETMEVVEMVLDGKINSKIVSMFIKNGGKAVGLSGKDGLLIVAEKKMMKVKKGFEEVMVDLGFVGETKFVNPTILRILLDNGFIPVVSPVSADLNGNIYNLNADNVAGDIASALKAKKLVMLTDVPGILRDVNDKNSLIPRMKLSELEEMSERGLLKGGMLPKFDAIAKALRNGVEKVHVIDGSRKHAILLELFTKEGVGTMVEL